MKYEKKSSNSKETFEYFGVNLFAKLFVKNILPKSG